MKHTILLFLACLICVNYVDAQKPVAELEQLPEALQIDGIEDSAWANANEYPIAVPFGSETPTLGEPGETTWKGFWGDEGIYLLIKVTDDVWSPAYAETSPADSLLFDHVEVYFDSNYILADGKGTNPDGNGGGNGHHLFSFSPVKGELISESNGAKYSYNIHDNGYSVECFIPYSRLTDWDGFHLDRSGPVGFDVTIVDNDTATPIHGRMNWANGGAIDENRINMDDAGLIYFSEPVIPGPAWVSKITLLPGAISTNNGTLQMDPVIEPEWATNKKLKWVVVNKTGMATIDSTGLVTAISNGIVEIQAFSTDWSNVQASAEIVITGQIIDKNETLKNDNQLSFFPNPTSGKIRLTFNQGSSPGTNLIIKDLTGKVIIDRFIRGKEELIDLTGKPKGVYFVITSIDNRVQKIILE